MPRMMELPVALLEMPAAEWAAAVVVRRSTRTYDGRPVDPDVLGRLEGFCESLPSPDVARVTALRDAPGALFTGIVGSYGKVQGAPSALVMIGRQDATAFEESVGYLGEAAILEATSLGLGTCWVAGFFDRSLASTLTPLAREERILAVSPLGHPQLRARMGERVMKRAVGAHTRRPVKDVAPGFDQGTWPAWAAEGVRLARAAPSAVNRQPWQFELETDPAEIGLAPVAAEPTGQVRVSATNRGVDGNISRRLDCGIAMLHFEVGARLMGAPGRWEILDPPQVARYRVTPA